WLSPTGSVSTDAPIVTRATATGVAGRGFDGAVGACSPPAHAPSAVRRPASASVRRAAWGSNGRNGRGDAEGQRLDALLNVLTSMAGRWARCAASPEPSREPVGDDAQTLLCDPVPHVELAVRER